MEYKDIIYEVKDRIAFITINRPKALNALLMKKESRSSRGNSVAPPTAAS
jgi:1,4-dihydroxy-2-naphthoyl-CoA synthase